VLHVPPGEVLFISANPWDACGARAFGLNVAWIERVTPEAMALACLESETLPPLTMFLGVAYPDGSTRRRARPSHPRPRRASRPGVCHKVLK
jgi:hypothetical protein